MGTTPKNKAVDAEYLLNQLKNLDKNILETKYVQEKDVKDTYTATDENPITIESNGYEYEKSEFENNVSNDVLAMIFDLDDSGCNSLDMSKFWIASRYIIATPDSADWGIFNIDNYRLETSMANSSSLYSSDGYELENLQTRYYIRPVVTLKADVELSGNSNDGWTIN